MRNVLLKEVKLSASILSYLFVLFGLMFMLPGYPILVAAFFVSFGIFHSFQNAREANDIVFSTLLPIAKRDVVKGKYLFACMIEAAGFLMMALSVFMRQTVFVGSVVYRANAMMNANGFALGMAAVIFGLFNWIFIGGFFKTAYKFARPFVLFIIAAFLTIGVAETLHHIPGLGSVNAFGSEHWGLQLILLLCGIVFYLLATVLSCRKACRTFERIDL